MTTEDRKEAPTKPENLEESELENVQGGWSWGMHPTGVKGNDGGQEGEPAKAKSGVLDEANNDKKLLGDELGIL